MVLPPRIDDASAKYQRAQVHLRELNSVLRRESDEHSWTLEQVGDLEPKFVRVRIKGEPPREVSVVLGDAIQNLRSSLDIATCGVVAFCDASFDLAHTHFPFGRDGLPLNKREREALGPIHPHILIAIEEARRLGGSYLQLLRELSNQDKHRLLVRTAVRQYPMKVQIDAEKQTADFVPDFDGQPDVWFRPLEDGDVIPMPTILNLRVGLFVDGQEHPYPLPAVDRINEAVGMALKLMTMAVDPPGLPTDMTAIA